jgi:hypothetical protein
MGRPKAVDSGGSGPGATKKTAAGLVEELLPVGSCTTNEIHFRAAVLEVGDAGQLMELAADTSLRPFLLDGEVIRLELMARCPHRARIIRCLSTQGVALGWYVAAPAGRNQKRDGDHEPTL